RDPVLRSRWTLHPHARSALGLARGPPCAPCGHVLAGGGRLVSHGGVVPADGASAAHDHWTPRAFHVLWSPLWITFVAYQWWVELEHRLLATVPDDVPMAQAQVAATLGTAGHIAGSAIEALFYVAWWRARGIPLSFLRLFEWLVSISVLDLLALG